MYFHKMLVFEARNVASHNVFFFSEDSLFLQLSCSSFITSLSVLFKISSPPKKLHSEPLN